MPTDEIPQLPGGEGQPQDAPQQTQEPVAPEPPPDPEPYRMKYRGEERELPYAPVNGLAEALGTTPEGVINFLQRSREADRIQRENIRLQQELDQARQYQQQAATYQQQMGGGPPPPQRYSHPQPQYAPPQAEIDDPIALLRSLQLQVQAQNQRFDQWYESAQQREQRLEQEREAAVREQMEQNINAQVERFLYDKNRGRKDPIDMEEFKQEMMFNGGVNRYAPIENVMERAWTWMTRDEMVQTAQRETLDKLRQPRATVTVQGARGGAAPAAPTATQQVGNMRLGDIISIDDLPYK